MENYYIILIIAAIVPYLICSINPAIIITRIKSGEDIRKIGSGNAGLTNTLGTQGKAAAAAVLLTDTAKGVISIIIIKFILGRWFGWLSDDIPWINNAVLWLAAAAAVLGHCYPVYYKFRGGKAVLVMVSTLFVIDWKSAAILLSLFAVIVLITRYVSLGSVIAAAAMPFCVYLISEYVNGGYINGEFVSHSGGGSLYYAIEAALVAALLIIKHRGNIKRLINGTEKKLGEKR